MNKGIIAVSFAAMAICLSCTTSSVQEACPGFMERSHPQLESSDSVFVKAYELAFTTISKNIRKNGIIRAGAEYDGKWTRDIAINTWNGCNFLFPEESEISLWGVTEEKDGATIAGHQFWDKIIWVPAVWEQYCVLGDSAYLRKAYHCSAATMADQEKDWFDASYGMFVGPSVFNDGIAGYEEPVFDPAIDSGFVLDYPAVYHIRCLSTNCIYYIAYNTLARMAYALGEPDAAAAYVSKADALKANIRKYLYDADASKLNYLVDQNGKVHEFQEGLGYAFAILGGIVDGSEAAKLLSGVHVAPFGLPSIWPDFARFSAEKPGRHNKLVWPHVNAFFALSALKASYEAPYAAARDAEKEQFLFELRNLADLSVVRNNGYYEIYNPETGMPDGGNQSGVNFNSSKRQTWCATGFLSMVFKGVLGMSFDECGLTVRPDAGLLRSLGISSVSGIHYRGAVINISCGPDAASKPCVRANGRKAKDGIVLIPSSFNGVMDINVQ